MTKDIQLAASSAESEALKLDSKKQATLEPYGFAKSKPTPAQSSENTGQESQSFQTSLQQTGKALDGLTSTPADFPARTLATQAKEPESQESAQASGKTIFKPLAYTDLNSSLLKTWQRSLIGDSTPFSVTLPRSGIMLNGIVFPLQQLARPTEGTESLSWPTPTAVTRERTAEQLSKRQKHYGGSKRAMYLQDAVILDQMRQWPTPTVRDSRTFKGARRLPGSQGSEPLVRQVGGTLNPEWVEWLMGFPIGWTELNVWETPSFPRWLNSLVRWLYKG